MDYSYKEFKRLNILQFLKEGVYSDKYLEIENIFDGLSVYKNVSLTKSFYYEL